MQKIIMHCQELKEYTKLRQFFCMAFAFFLFSQFIIPSNFAYSWIFYLLVGVPCIALYSSDKRIRHSFLSHTIVKYFCVLCLYSVVHDWIFDSTNYAIDTTRHTIATLIFVMSAILWCCSPQDYLTKCYKFFLHTVIICGIISIISHLVTFGAFERLSAIGQNDHPILGANIYSIFTMLGFYFLHPEKQDNLFYKRIVPYAAIIITGLLVILTQSRGPFIAFGVCCFIGLLATKHYKTIALGSTIICFLMLDFIFYSQHAQHYLPIETIYESALYLLNRESHRMNIWILTVQLISEKPLIGYNLQTMFPYAFGGVNPHNIFLGAWYYTGIFGFFLLMTIVISSFGAVLRRRNTAKGLLGILLMLYAILACMTDQGQYVDSPSPLWSIFWLPITYAMAFKVKERMLGFVTTHSNKT